MSTQEKRVTIFASSASSTNVSADKSNFVYTFNPPLQIPKGKQPHIQLVGAEVFWNVPNVNSGVNSTMEISMTNVNGGSANISTASRGPGVFTGLRVPQTEIHMMDSCLPVTNMMLKCRGTERGLGLV